MLTAGVSGAPGTDSGALTMGNITAAACSGAVHPGRLTCDVAGPQDMVVAIGSVARDPRISARLRILLGQPLVFTGSGAVVTGVRGAGSHVGRPDHELLASAASYRAWLVCAPARAGPGSSPLAGYRAGMVGDAHRVRADTPGSEGGAEHGARGNSGFTAHPA